MTALPQVSEATIWQQVEFGSYDADLAVWADMAVDVDGTILELGAGAGRVALDLVARGHDVIAVENDPDLAAELERAAEREQLSLTVLQADLGIPGELRPPTRATLSIAPLHVLQLFDGPTRFSLLKRLRELLAQGGRLAATVVDEPNLLSAGAAAKQILPDMREVEGWVYSSEPLWVLVGEDTFTVRRVRERVSPDGAMERTTNDELLHRVSPERLEIEAEKAGFRVIGRRQIGSGPREADSIVVIAEAAE